MNKLKYFIERAEKRLNNGFNFSVDNFNSIINELELENEEYEPITWEEVKDELISNGWYYYDYEDSIVTKDYTKDIGLIEYADDEYDDIVEEVVKNNLETALLEKREKIEASKTSKNEFVYLHKDVISAMLNLDVYGVKDWYKNILLNAGYSERAAKRKITNGVCGEDALIDKLDDWYKTELYPKLCNKYESEGKTIF